MRWNLAEICPRIFEPAIYSEIKNICDELELLNFPDKSGEALLDELNKYNLLVEKSDEILTMLSVAMNIDNANEELKNRFSAAEEMELRVKRQQNVLSEMYAQNSGLFDHPYIRDKYKGFLLRLEENASINKETLDVVAAMSITSSKAWRKFHNFYLDKTQKEMSASFGILQNQVRTGSYDEAKAAFEKTAVVSEKAAPTALEAMNNIKKEFIFLTELYKKDSPLVFSLEKNLLTKELFSKYMSMAEIVGKDALEMLLGPDGKSDFRIFSLDRIECGAADDITIDYDGCIDIVRKCFSERSPRLAELLGESVRFNLIDNEPRHGKRSGACMQSVHSIRKTFTLCNDEGSLRALISLAHEMGHVFHHHCLFDEPILEHHSPTVISECISNLSELMLFDYLIRSGEFPREIIVEMWLKKIIQTNVLTYSRFLFEDKFFEMREAAPITLDQACGLMSDAQMSAFHGFLAKSDTAPYDWVNKPHFYYPQRPYYNYPYVVGYLTALLVFANLKSGLVDFGQLGEALRQTGRFSSIEEFFVLLDISAGDLSDSRLFSPKNII